MERPSHPLNQGRHNLIYAQHLRPLCLISFWNDHGFQAQGNKEHDPASKPRHHLNLMPTQIEIESNGESVVVALTSGFARIQLLCLELQFSLTHRLPQLFSLNFNVDDIV